MGEDKKKSVGSITPKRVRAIRRADGSLEILEDLKPKEEKLESFSFTNRDELRRALLQEGIDEEES